MRKSLFCLLALNFFMADMQAGIGPFLGIFLQQHGWQAGLIGTVMTIGSVAGVLMIAPAGALIDASKAKRAFVIFPGAFTVIASAVILYSQNFWVVAFSQVATAIAASAIGPAVLAITLGMVRQKGFNRQNGRNQAVNHAGNLSGAALSGWLGWQYGFTAVFVLAAVFGALAIASVMMIPGDAIDNRAARGARKKKEENDSEVDAFAVLWKCKPLLILAAALAFFHLGNGAMLPLYGLAVVAKQKDLGTGFVAVTIIVAQATMIFASLWASKAADKRGYWTVILISFLALPLRGLIASQFISTWGVYPVQFLDGIGAGLQSVAIPGLVTRIMNGTGRINAGQGALMTVQNIGGAMSPLVGGWLAQTIGYPSTFVILGGFAVVSVVVWIKFADLIRPTCGGVPEDDFSPSTSAA